MAVSTSAVMQTAAPAGSSRSQDTGNDDGNGFKDVMRDVSNPKERGSKATRETSGKDEAVRASSDDPGEAQPEGDAGDLLKLLEVATGQLASPATAPGDAVPQAPVTASPADAAGLAALLGLPQAVASQAPAATGQTKSAIGTGSPAFAGGTTAQMPATGNPGQPVPVTPAGSPAGQPAGAGQGNQSGAPLSGLDDEGLFARFAVAPEEVSLKSGEVRSGEAMRAVAEVGQVRVLREETHFAPSLRLSPIQQVGEAITGALADARPAPGSSQAAGASLSHSAEHRPMVKVLEIQLQPMELGSVKVALRLIGDQVEVVMSAQHAETAELLKQDRQLLDQMLRAVGQKADTITIQTAADDRPMFQINGSPQGQSTGWNASNDGNAVFGGEAREGGDSGNGPGGDGASRQKNDETDHSAHAALAEARNDHSGAVYL